MDMDCPSVYNVQPGRLPVDQGMQQHQHQQLCIPSQTKTTPLSPFESDDLLQDDFFARDPCSGVENWSGPNPESLLPIQQYGGLEPSHHTYPLSPSSSPQKVPVSTSLHFFDTDHHHNLDVSPFVTTESDTELVKLEPSPMDGCANSSQSDWAYDAYLNLPPSLDQETYYTPLPSDIPGTCPPASSETLDTIYHTTEAEGCPSLSPPRLSSSDEGSPDPIKSETSPETSPLTPGNTECVDRPKPYKHMPYSKLIEMALLTSPDRKLPLADIYSWIERNTTKGERPDRGWHNSIRHNLSMNAGFEPLKGTGPKCKRNGSIWRLSSAAINHGVQSTTRYRYKQKAQANQDKVQESERSARRQSETGGKGGKKPAKPFFSTNAQPQSPKKGRKSLTSRTQTAAAATTNALRQQQRQKQKQQHRQQQQPPSELYYQRFAPAPAPSALPAFSEPDPGNVHGQTETSWSHPAFRTDNGGSACLSMDIGIWTEFDYHPHSNELSSHELELPNGLPYHNGWSTPE